MFRMFKGFGKAKRFHDLLLRDFANDEIDSPTEQQRFLKELACVLQKHGHAVSSLLNPCYTFSSPSPGVFDVCEEKLGKNCDLDVNNLERVPGLKDIISDFVTIAGERMYEIDYESDSVDEDEMKYFAPSSAEILHSVWAGCFVAGLSLGETGYTCVDINDVLDFSYYEDFSFSEFGELVLLFFDAEMYGGDSIGEVLKIRDGRDKWRLEKEKWSSLWSDLCLCCDDYFKRRPCVSFSDFCKNHDGMTRYEVALSCCQNLILLGIWCAFTRQLRIAAEQASQED